MSDLPVRVLLVEDSIDDAHLLKRALAVAPSRYSVSQVEYVHEAEHQLGSATFDVVLTDLSLPDSDLRSTVFRLCKTANGTPVIALTGMSPGELAMTLLDQGAQDYLLKDDITPESLDRSIQYAIQRNRNRREIEQLLGEVQQSRQLLERKNRRLARLYRTAQRFVSNVSHEFRTPLTVIREYTDLLREGLLGPVSEEQSRYLDIVVDRADDLNRMVDDMLDVSKLEVGLLGAWRRRCQVRDIVEYHMSALARKAELKSVCLKLDVPDDLPAVYCDAEKVGRVIVNLVVNAIKFCGEQGIVNVWARPDKEHGGVVIGITDNGPGIDPESRELIFRRYKQLGTACHSGSKGVGLGLSIAQELVELNFGQLSVEGLVGEGSTFSFTLPPDDPRELIRRYLDRRKRRPHDNDYVSFLCASIDDSHDLWLADEVDSFFNYQLRRHDLLFRIHTAQWLLIVPEPESEVKRLSERIFQQLHEANRNRPDGALPEIALQTVGTWPTSTDSSVLLASLERFLESRESIHA